MNKFYGKSRVILCEDPEDLGRKSAAAVAAAMRQLLKDKCAMRAVFAAGESQGAFLRALALEPDLDWTQVECINMDDFWDTHMPERFTCGFQTRTQLYDAVFPGEVHLVKFNAPDPEEEAARFENLLRSRPIDLLCQGIGTSGHLALNEPGDTRFDDARWVRVVDICEQSKKQLIADPNFRGLGSIPEKGITMTIPALLSAAHTFTMVPLGLKKPILTRLAEFTEPSELLPASILLTTEGDLFVDKDSSPEAWLPSMAQV